MAIKPISVYQLNNYIGNIIGTDPLLGNVTVVGEISNLNFHQRGHVYFSLKDSRSKINCFLRADKAPKFADSLEEGGEIIVMGNVNLYEPGGYYSLNVKDIEIKGLGDLAIAFEKMKEKLEKEGLFDINHKLPLPDFPNKVGIITAKTGAAVQDMIRIISNRNKYVDIIVFPVTVQGVRASGEIAKAIENVNQNYKDIDVLIVGRGGGSAEDLWAFNEEVVARSIYNSKIPIISAVGHEIDFSISDFVADIRAATPTDAANIAVYDSKVLDETLENYQETLKKGIMDKLQRSEQSLDSYKIDLLKTLLLSKIEKYSTDINSYKNTLEALTPNNVLKRGYAIVRTSDGNLVYSIKNVKVKQSLTIKLKDGSFKSQVENIKDN